MTVSDPFDLRRFVLAQDAGGVYLRALTELRAGRKESHWMWFVFPQLAGLGVSDTSRRYGISSLAEAQAYLAHQVLGPRLLEATGVVQATRALSAEDVFGSVDAQKMRSCATLFLRAAPAERILQQVLDRFFAGTPDPATDRILDQLCGGPVTECRPDA